MAVTLCTNQGSYSSAYALLTATGTPTRTNSTHVTVSVTYSIKKSSSTSWNSGSKYFLLLTSSNAILGYANITSHLVANLSGKTSLGPWTISVPIAVGASYSSQVVRCAISASASSISASGTLIWNGKTNTSTSPCTFQNATLSFSNYMAKVTPAAGTYIASVSGGGTVTKGSAVSIACTLGSATGYTYAFSQWTSSNTSAVSSTTTRSPSISTSSIAAGGAVTMTASATRSLNYYTLTVKAANAYIASVSGGGSKGYGASCTITATPASATGYTYGFANWTFSGSKTGTNTSKSCTFTMPNGAVTATAYGTRSTNSYTLTVQANNDYIASVTGGGSKTYGSSVTVGCTLASATGYTTTFANWTFSGGKTGTNTSQSCTFTMPYAATTAKAYATRTVNSYTLTVSASNSYVTEVSGGGSKSYNATCTINCKLAEATGYKYTFANWTFGGSKSGTNTSQSCTFEMPAGNVTAVAAATRTANTYQQTFSNTHAYNVNDSGNIEEIQSDYWQLYDTNGNASVNAITVNMTYNSSTTNLTPSARPENGATIEFDKWVTNAGSGSFAIGAQLPTTWNLTSNNTYYALFTGTLRNWKKVPNTTNVYRSIIRQSYTNGAWVQSEDYYKNS